ncbi:MAG: hypothetical protein M3N34_00735 [Pseudomonadota bacterium]|nr:hypothetical protein [Pseudomonadota bacterium]
MFFGPKITTVFASRWKALAWSASVLMTAYCSVPSKDADGAKSPSVDPAVSVVQGLIGTGAPVQADSHVSPWAIVSPTPVPKD